MLESQCLNETIYCKWSEDFLKLNQNYLQLSKKGHVHQAGP